MAIERLPIPIPPSSLADAHFRGRESELNELDQFVGVLRAKSVGEYFHDFVHKFVRNRQRSTLLCFMA